MTYNNDPFSRIPNALTSSDAQLGDITNIDDKFEEEKAALSGFVPTEASTESGYRTMLEILKKYPSHDWEDTPTEPQQTREIKYPNPVFNEPKQDTLETRIAPTEDKEPVKDVPEGAQATPEYKDEDLLPILDAILTSGFARDTFTIRNAKIKLRTQFFWEDQFVVEKTDKLANDTTLKQSMAFYLQVYSLACNLEAMGDNVFPVSRVMTQEEQRKSFEDRVNFLLSLPTVIVNIIFNKRMEFVNKIQYIQENFDRLIKLF